MDHPIPELDKAGLRRFGITTGAIVGVLFGVLLPWLFGLGYPLWPWIVFAVLALWGLAAPTTLQPVYYWWMRFGLLLNKVTSPIIMGVVFFVVLLPMALVMRYVARRDPLRRQFDAAAESYRIESAQTDSDGLRRPF